MHRPASDGHRTSAGGSVRRNEANGEARLESSPIEAFVRASSSQPSVSRQREVMRAIVARPDLHARWLNTLARLEYVGVRKMLKARRSETLDFDGLRHVLEEAAHATRLKKAALAVAVDRGAVQTFADEHTLSGDAAEHYFQAIDCESARLVRASAHESDHEACYLLTSTAIELRARSLYPDYQAILELAGSAVSVSSIIGDEQNHLEHMAAELPQRVQNWQSALTAVMQVEEAAFQAYLARVESILTQA